VRDERGFSRELLIAILIIGLLIVIAFNRLLALRFEAERMMVQSVVTGLLSALYIDFAAAAAKGQMDRIDAAPAAIRCFG